MLITAMLMLYVSGTAVAVEMLITAVLVLVVFAAAADSNNTPSVKDNQHVSGTAAADSNNTVNAAVSADVVCFRYCCCC
jgi:hypothetical protein